MKLSKGDDFPCFVSSFQKFFLYWFFCTPVSNAFLDIFISLHLSYRFPPSVVLVYRSPIYCTCSPHHLLVQSAVLFNMAASCPRHPPASVASLCAPCHVPVSAAVSHDCAPPPPPLFRSRPYPRSMSAPGGVIRRRSLHVSVLLPLPP